MFLFHSVILCDCVAVNHIYIYPGCYCKPVCSLQTIEKCFNLILGQEYSICDFLIFIFLLYLQHFIL